MTAVCMTAVFYMENIFSSKGGVFMKASKDVLMLTEKIDGLTEIMDLLYILNHTLTFVLSIQPIRYHFKCSILLFQLHNLVFQFFYLFLSV